MKDKNTGVDKYLVDGCMRCPLGATPQCKVNFWQKELKQLRKILLESELTEDLKWKVPCYTYQGKNVVILSAFKDCCTLNFFKGALLKDPKQILEKPGENTQSGRVIRFTDTKQIRELQATITMYIREAIDLEKTGAKVEFKKNPEPVPEELQIQLNKSRNLKKAFESLTPGRQREYILNISSAKQSKTRAARVEKYMPLILAGKGLSDEYRSNRK